MIHQTKDTYETRSINSQEYRTGISFLQLDNNLRRAPHLLNRCLLPFNRFAVTLDHRDQGITETLRKRNDMEESVDRNLPMAGTRHRMVNSHIKLDGHLIESVHSPTTGKREGSFVLKERPLLR